ncbi:MAG: GAF domain-containing protein, partial [Deltaproteobacteria bacterium]
GEGRVRELLQELHPERLERIFAAGNGSLTDHPRMLILFSATEVERTPDTWLLIEMIPKVLISSGLHPRQIALFLATLLLFGFVVAATFLLFHTMRRPVRRLAREAGRLAEGDLDAPSSQGHFPFPELERIEDAIRRLSERLRNEYLNQERRVREEATKFETIIEEYIRHEVELKEANEAQERRLEELQALNVVSEVLITSENLEDQLQTAIQTICGVLHATSATIGLLTPKNPKMLLTRIYRSGHALRGPMLMPLQEITGHSALSERRIVSCEDLFETSIGRLSQELAASEEFRAFLSLPLLNKGNPLGLITLMFEEPRTFAQEEIDLASMIADQVAVAVERAELREEIHEKIRQLEASDKLKSEFIRNISHELRTPLNAIIGYTSILIEQIYGTINDDQHQALGKVIVHAKHLLKMINQILDLSRIDAGQMTIVPEEVEIETLIEETTSIFAHLVREKQIELCKEVSPQIPPLMLDKTKVSQILTNLLDNAVKFTEQGIVTVRVDFDPQEERLCLEVTDTGIGIEATHLETIFDAFRQVDGTTTRKYGGSGLGLAITRELVQLMKGTIEARSRPGEGSTFTITIPVRPAPSLPQTSGEPPQTERRALSQSDTR